jgi:hypothetical protein
VKIWTRRKFIQVSGVAVSAATMPAHLQSTSGNEVVSAAAAGFSPIALKGNTSFEELAKADLSETLHGALTTAPRGSVVSWGIPFRIDRPLLLKDQAVLEQTPGLKAEWLVFQHTTDTKPINKDGSGFIRPMRGEGYLAEHIADYIILFADGTEAREAIRRRHQIGMLRTRWGENCFQAVTQNKPFPVQTGTRVVHPDRSGGWLNWLWAWQNPYPEKEIASLRFEPVSGAIVISAISAGKASSQPLRWQQRRKAILKMPGQSDRGLDVDSKGQWTQIQVDMGQVISVEPRTLYPKADWERTYNNKLPERREHELLVEYTAHADAYFHLWDESKIPVAALEKDFVAGPLTRVLPATRRVKIRVLEKNSGNPVPVKLHVHGESGEFLRPVDHHRITDNSWFRDYAPEYRSSSTYEAQSATSLGDHRSAYINGESLMDLPIGTVYIEISKGFEIKPIRRKFSVTAATDVIEVVIERILPWRERGWVTADTHVHFLSPSTARLEGAAEGVNVVNLLASQWGEIMTNVGDFDGTITHGSKEAGGDGEWLVRVGTENRQHVLGHISLLGYKGPIIAPMGSGGPDESAFGDPIEVLLMEWAEQCRQQGGIVIFPHFPNPRCEQAAALVEEKIDGVEMTSYGDPYGGINPYSLSDWYRYLNLGYFTAAVGGTDKMDAETAVGTVRTYARISHESEFTYESWKAAIRAGETFVTYGPLMQFAVEGQPAGSRIAMKSDGGTVDVTWQAASVTVPMSKVELIVNGEVRESRALKPDQDAGQWKLRIDRSSWVALLVRGSYSDRPEIIAAHSSPVMIPVEGTQFFAAADAVTILDQIEGALAYIDTIGTRAENEAYKRMRMKLTSAYRKLHNRLHQKGHYHDHSGGTAHE